MNAGRLESKGESDKESEVRTSSPSINLQLCRNQDPLHFLKILQNSVGFRKRKSEKFCDIKQRLWRT
jgi:hypothetical protein